MIIDIPGFAGFAYRATMHLKYCYIDINISKMSAASILYVILCPVAGLVIACHLAFPRYFMKFSKFRGKRSCICQHI